MGPHKVMQVQSTSNNQLQSSKWKVKQSRTEPEMKQKSKFVTNPEKQNPKICRPLTFLKQETQVEISMATYLHQA